MVCERRLLNVRSVIVLSALSVLLYVCPATAGLIRVPSVGIGLHVGNEELVVSGGSVVQRDYVVVYSGGRLEIADGGQVIDFQGLLYPQAGGTCEVRVTGANSLWDNTAGIVSVESSEQFWIGFEGDSSLLISDGGRVLSESARVKAESGGTAIVTVTGSGSLWTNTYDLNVGDFPPVDGKIYQEPHSLGYGTIVVRDGGLVETETMTVWPGSVLTGDGTFKATQIINNGIIRPGNSIGTLTIDGNLSLIGDTSVVEFEVDNEGNCDKLVVSGFVGFRRQALVPVPVETLLGAHEYTVIEANSVEEKIQSMEWAYPVAEPGLIRSTFAYGEDPNSILLRVTALSFDDPNVVRTGNHVSLGSALQRIAESGGNEVTTTLQQLQTGSEVRVAYNQLSGQTTPSLAPVTVAGGGRHVGVVSSRLRSFAGGVARDGSFGDSSDRLTSDVQTVGVDAGRYLFAMGNGSPVLGDRSWGVWGKGYGLYGDRESDSGVPGYQYTVYGAAFGADYRFTEHLLLGLTGGYSDSDIDYSDSRDNSDVSTTHSGLYASYETSRWYLDSILTYANLDYETRRYVDLVNERLEGDPSGDMLTGYIEAGLNLWRSGPILIQPLAAFQFSTLHIDGFTETGGSSALTFDDERYESYKGSLGVKIARQLFERANGFRMDLELRGRWVHEFGDTNATFDAAFASEPGVTFRVSDADISRDSAVLGAGLNTWFTQQTRLFLDYGTELNPDHTTHLVSAGLEHRW